MRPSLARLRRGLRDLASAPYRQTRPLEDIRMLALGTGVPPAEQPIPDASRSDWRAVSVGSRWGGRDEYAWFTAVARIPQEWVARLDAASDEYAVALRWIFGAERDVVGFGWPEGLLYVNGRLQQGINRYHADALLRDDDARQGEARLAARLWCGWGKLEVHDQRIERADIALLDRKIEALYWLLTEGADTVEALPESDPLTYALYDAIESAYNALDLHELYAPASDAFAVSAHRALATLQARLAELRAQYTPAERPVVTAVGHGHLDVAWLWQTRHTREKTARTFGVATALMERYPDYVFMHTTPQVYAWLKSDYPALYERVRERVREGRFEAGGAMWLESDTNIVSGEALVRQILYGQRFLREEFGREYDALWLPDTFGYTAALPQILLRAGIPVFMTTKMSWNDTNRIPADTFWWRGLDGSEALAYFITAGGATGWQTYNGDISARFLVEEWASYRQKAINSEVLLAFGHGDGGAGPSRQHLERAKAVQQVPGLPELRLGRADEFFHRLLHRVRHAKQPVPVWDGELYLEYHRGVYTTQSWLKRAHRQNEARLLLAETLDAWRWSLRPQRAPDARATLDDAWRMLLLHEFHDILPGSSIHEVYADARVAMDALERQLEGFIAEAYAEIAHDLRAGETPGAALLALNPSPWARPALLELPAGAIPPGAHALDATGLRLTTQAASGADGAATLLVEVPELPARGIATLTIGERGHAPADPQALESAQAEERLLENSFFRILFNHDGEIVSFVDKRAQGLASGRDGESGGRELVIPGQTLNRFEAFDDRPESFDAWDINASYAEKQYPLGAAHVEVVERGPLRATLRITRDLLASHIEQRVSIYRHIPRVDFATRIEWHNRQVLLKVAFPLDLRVTAATSEIQYGAIARPTHRNTSWDAARFETAAHRWVDLSEPEYGVSLLNDGRYGHDAHDSTLRLTLAHGPVWPDPQADEGEHLVTYSLYPHLGDWRAGGTVAEGYALNRPVRALPLAAANRAAANPAGALAGGEGAPAASFFAARPANVVVETVKRPADRQDHEGLIVRVYEAFGARVEAWIEAPRPVGAVAELDLLERPLREGESPAYDAWYASPTASHDAPKLDGNGFTFQLRPFEIRTFRVQFA